MGRFSRKEEAEVKRLSRISELQLSNMELQVPLNFLGMNCTSPTDGVRTRLGRLVGEGGGDDSPLFISGTMHHIDKC